jgi:hypothetical protein
MLISADSVAGLVGSDSAATRAPARGEPSGCVMRPEIDPVIAPFDTVAFCGDAPTPNDSQSAMLIAAAASLTGGMRRFIRQA